VPPPRSARTPRSIKIAAGTEVGANRWIRACRNDRNRGNPPTRRCRIRRGGLSKRKEQKNVIARDDSKAPPSSVRRDPSATRDGRRERKESSTTRDQQQADNDPVRTSRSRSSSVRRFLSSSNAESRRNGESSRSRAPSEDSRRSAPSSTSSDRADGKHSSRRGTSRSQRGSVGCPRLVEAVVLRMR
jgi:hypothetical protein